MAWTWDAPGGVYRNRALSAKIRTEAIADTIFMKFVRPEPGFGKGKGDTITITRILALPLATTVSETERLPTGRPAIQTKSVQVQEWGFKLELTDFEKQLSHYNPLNQYQRLLREQITLTMDKMVADAFKTTPYLYVPVSTGGAFDTDGTVTVTADVNLSVTDLRAIHDELAGTLKVPKFRNGMYVGILSVKAARGIMNDPEFKDWLAPHSSQTFISGKLPITIEGFSLFVTNHTDSLSNGVGSNSILGEAVFFGDDPGFLAEIQTPELRAGIPEDLGRFRQTGWVGIIQAGLSWEQAATARVIYVTSA